MCQVTAEPQKEICSCEFERSYTGWTS